MSDDSLPEGVFLIERIIHHRLTKVIIMIQPIRYSLYLILFLGVFSNVGWLLIGKVTVSILSYNYMA